MVSIEAAGADPDMRAAADAGAAATHQVYLGLTENLHARGALRDGMDAVTAADVLYVLCSPQTFQLLRRHRNRGAERYRDWLLTTSIRELIG